MVQPRLGLYNRVIEGTGFKEYLLRHADGHQAAMIRFHFRSETFMLDYHLPSHHRWLIITWPPLPRFWGCIGHMAHRVAPLAAPLMMISWRMFLMLFLLLCSSCSPACIVNVLRFVERVRWSFILCSLHHDKFVSHVSVRRPILRDDFMSSVANHIIVHRCVDKHRWAFLRTWPGLCGFVGSRNHWGLVSVA